jgi:predicted HTH domain antitoxin
MDWVNVRQLKNNPTAALRSATKGPVLVLKGDLPEAVILHLDPGQTPAEADLRLALATALFKAGTLSLGRAARVGGVGVGALMSHLSRLGVAVVSGERADAVADLETFEEWLASS